jgi:hydrogenase expression/formation protein HypC
MEQRDGMRRARVQFGGIVREALLDFVPEAEVGDYVMVHVGFAISVVDTDEAERTLELLGELGLPEGGELPAVDEPTDVQGDPER